jgi:hypothetical protein
MGKGLGMFFLIVFLPPQYFSIIFKRKFNIYTTALKRVTLF